MQDPRDDAAIDLSPYPTLAEGESPPTGRPEDRVRTRVGVDFSVQLYSRDFSGPLQAEARDLGVGGVCVATRSPFAHKSISRVALALPGGGLSLEAEGRWQREAQGDDRTFTGIAFVEPPPDAIDRISDVLLEQGKVLARFLFGRSDLSRLGIDEAMGLAHASRFRTLAPGAWVYGQDAETEDSIYVVHSGEVLLQVRVRDAIETPIARLGPGSLFGGMSLIAGIPNAESAVAEGEVRLLEIARDAFLYLSATRPWLAQRLAEAVTRSYARRLQLLLQRVRNAL